jgi:hypothetical protein
LEIPPASTSSIDSDTNLPIDLDHQDADSDINMSDTPIHLPNDNNPSSPPPFQPEVELEVQHDQADQAFASTNYHPFINGRT